MPTLVIVFQNDRSFAGYRPVYQGKPVEVGGYFIGGEDANAIAVNARHKGRKYTLTGRIETLMEDGEDYNLIFDIPEIRDMALKPLPFDAQFKVSVSCLFRPNQLTTVLALREGQKVTLTGTVYKYDNFRKVIWLENCTKAK